MSREYIICQFCGGDGIETCNNPDHGFIHGGAAGRDVARIGCPVCGHEPNYKVKGSKCPDCKGSGTVAPAPERLGGWCDCEPHFEMPGEVRCSRCHKNMRKPEMNEIENEIERLAELGLGYLQEPNTSIKSGLKKLALDAYRSGMESARKVYTS